MNRLPGLPDGRREVSRWVRTHLADLCGDVGEASSIPGGQQAADAALAAFDVRGYADHRNEAWPLSRRGASGLSPYIRHGLLTLGRVWNAVEGGPDHDVSRFRDELLWQEYARHLYARLGTATRHSLRFSVPERGSTDVDRAHGGPDANRAVGEHLWSGGEACLSQALQELRETGWLPNQMRMWLASHWSVRQGGGWRDGEDHFFRHLLDGSRAANRVGWQWTAGALTGKSYGFSRWQVQKRAPGLCASCPVEDACPIADWPPDEPRAPLPMADPRLRRDQDVEGTSGPEHAVSRGIPEAVWLTAESLGQEDPAIRAHPELPLVFVFDERLLMQLRLSVTRITFLAETLADLSGHRDVEVWRGDPSALLADRPVATTFAPVPGWRSISDRLTLAMVHPWPWLIRPHAGSVASFSAWRKAGGGVIGP